MPGHSDHVDLKFFSGASSISGTLADVQKGYRGQIFLLRGQRSIQPLTWKTALAAFNQSMAAELVAGPDYAFSFQGLPKGDYTLLILTYPPQIVNNYDRELYGRYTSHSLTLTAHGETQLQLRVP